MNIFKFLNFLFNLFFLVNIYLIKSTEGANKEAGEVEFETFRYKNHDGIETEYQRGTFFVKENRSKNDSRVIGIGFSLFKTDNTERPPVFFLPGGPGSSFLQSEPPDFDRTGGPFLANELLGRCDLVFVDQRGYSKRGLLLDDREFIAQPLEPNSALNFRVKEFERFTKEDVNRYKKREVDLSGYSILGCIDDVNDLRECLGYDKIILRGQSFGSQWSLGIMRKYPEIVERALLTGVEPLNNSYDMPSHVLNAVKRMWSWIDKDSRFKPYLPPGGMNQAAEMVIERLENTPVKILEKNSRKLIRTIGPEDFPWWDPASILELYHCEYSGWRSRRSHRIVPRTLIQPLIDSSLGVTEKRRKRLWSDPAVRYISRSNFAPLLATAEIWPSPDVGDDFRKPILCDVPVVFVNGDWDIKTPIENMYEISGYFPNHKKVAIQQGGHGTINNKMSEEHPDFIDQLALFLLSGRWDDLPSKLTIPPYRSFRIPDFEI